MCDEIVLIDQGVAVAAGTPSQLKRDLERDVLEIHFETAGDFDRAVGFIEGVAGSALDPESKSVSVPVPDGARGSLALLRRLDDEGVGIADFQLRRPTLDDVFLTLTDAEEVGR